ncbi:MAG: cupin domain-containing protein [Anaerolineae bacterium]
MVTVRHYTDVEGKPAADGVTMRLVIGPAEGAPYFNMRVFDVQPGHATPYHEHWWEHEVFVLDGQGVVRGEDGEQQIGAGSTVLVPGGQMHQFRNVGNGTLRFICLVPQEWLEGSKRE